MRSMVLWCLLGVNIALVALFVLPRVRDNSALAQGVNRPADYLLIPGTVSGIDRGVVYIVDTTNGMMSAVAYEDSSGTIEVMPPTDLTRTFQEGPTRRTTRNR